jgi:hypothetical protein
MKQHYCNQFQYMLVSIFEKLQAIPSHHFHDKQDPSVLELHWSYHLYCDTYTVYLNLT